MHSLFGLGVMNVGVPGMMPFSMERMVLTRPEMPAAGSECPMLLLICLIIRLADVNGRCLNIAHRADYERIIESTTGSENRCDSTDFRGISSLD
jgi:hypothetical protein